MATCDPAVLMALAKQFQGCDLRMLKMAMLQLLCDASGGGGGGGGTTIAVKKDGAFIVPAATTLNFTGQRVDVTADSPTQAGIDIQNPDVTLNGTPVAQDVAVLNFTDRVLATSMGGGVVNIQIIAGVLTNSGDPNGVIEATGPAICLDDANERIWWKTTTGTSDNEWF